MSAEYLKRMIDDRPNPRQPQGQSTGIYRAFTKTPKPQMGFTVIRASGEIDGFLFHNLDNINLTQRGNAEFLTFTHRGKAVTLQGIKLVQILHVLLSNALEEIREHDGRPVAADETIVQKIRVTVSDMEKKTAKSEEDNQSE